MLLFQTCFGVVSSVFRVLQGHPRVQLPCLGEGKARARRVKTAAGKLSHSCCEGLGFQKLCPALTCSRERLREHSHKNSKQRCH